MILNKNSKPIERHKQRILVYSERLYSSCFDYFALSSLYGYFDEVPKPEFIDMMRFLSKVCL